MIQDKYALMIKFILGDNMHILSQKTKHENGSVIVFFALCMTVMLGVCALVIDYGILVHKRILS